MLLYRAQKFKAALAHNEGDIRCVELKRKLREALREEYEGGIRPFICGMASGSDMYFAEAVLRLREELPDITLEAAVPYEEQSRGWRPGTAAL